MFCLCFYGYIASNLECLRTIRCRYVILELGCVVYLGFENKHGGPSKVKLREERQCYFDRGGESSSSKSGRVIHVIIL